ncbi:hypothetical protein CPLU01_15277 [Colletotrichum plurivorum]|uniref:Uncharacterized protein n=1 Tax=Colletotrichum plurivorum TaxID=2175906 RepID=A0A8H6JCN0_9PEZI|nr:hypothetical protein CPLU01_15277 [Colletotrichum plurivorum]
MSTSGAPWALLRPLTRLRRLVITLPWHFNPRDAILGGFGRELAELKQLRFDYLEYNMKCPILANDYGPYNYRPALEQLDIRIVPQQLLREKVVGEILMKSFVAIKLVFPNIKRLIARSCRRVYGYEERPQNDNGGSGSGVRGLTTTKPRCRGGRRLAQYTITPSSFAPD